MYVCVGIGIMSFEENTLLLVCHAYFELFPGGAGDFGKARPLS
jgi:hypothetical protein